MPKRGIYDYMRTAVDRVKRGKERDVNVRFAATVSHFLFEAEFCNPASGWEKGQVEKNVRDARHRLWQSVPAFPDLGGPQCLAAGALYGPVARDRARGTTRHSR